MRVVYFGYGDGGYEPNERGVSIEGRDGSISVTTVCRFNSIGIDPAEGP
jgi:hypothetical protein